MNSKNRQIEICAALDKVMKDLGVENFVIIGNDPDSDYVFISSMGPLAWRVGALTLKLNEIKNEWGKGDAKEDGDGRV